MAFDPMFMTITTAVEFCKGLGGRVLEPRDADKMASVAAKSSEFGFYAYYLGVTDVHEEGV